MVITGASMARHFACAGGMATPVPGEPQRRLDEPRPGQRPGMAPQLVQARGHARDGARRGADVVVHELLPERDRQLLEHGRRARLSQPGHGHEEVEHLRPAAARLDQDGVAAARDPRHHALRDARGEGRSDGGVGRRPAFGEDLEAGFGRGGMARGNSGRRLHLC